MEVKRGEAVQGTPNKMVLKKAVSHKVKQLSEKAVITDREVYDLIRGFFKKYISIDYEFTSEELIKEMRKVYLPGDLHKRVSLLLSAVSEMEHLSREFSKIELLHILQEFNSIVNDMITTHYEDKGFLKKIADWLHLGVSKEPESALDPNRLLSENERIVVKMNMLLDNGRRFADKNPELAKKCYHELRQMYESLDHEKKKAYYMAVSELYAMLKNKGL
jgi:hypothetical protein